KKTKQLITAGVIKSQQIIDIKVNQGLRGHKTVKGFEFIGEEGGTKQHHCNSTNATGSCGIFVG
ncbi:hypothetical protein ACS39N_004696, partial [Escherichia coli]